MRREKHFQMVIGALLAVLLVPTLLIIDLGTAAAQKLERTTIKVGVAAALKRPYGIASLRGAEMLAKEVNDAGGVLGSKIQLFSADTEATAPKATEAIEKLFLSDKVDTIVGAYSSEEATAFQEQSAKLKLNIIFHGTTHIMDTKYKSDPEKYKYYWNYEPSDIQFAEAIVQYQLPMLVNELKKGLNLSKINVAVVTDVALWTEAMDGVFIKGVKANPDCQLVYTGKISRDAVDFSAELTEMRKKEVQLLIMACGYAAAYTFDKQAHDLQFPAVLAGMHTLAWSVSDFIKAVGMDAAAYIVTNGFGCLPTTPHTVQMLKLYEKVYGGVPHLDTGITYNGLKTYTKAVEMARTLNQDKVAEALKKVRLSENEAWGAKAFWYEDNHRARVNPKDGTIIYDVQYNTKGGVNMLNPQEYKTGAFVIPPWMVKAWKK
jgi:branched-chain amino acid transport system substrate-binding protein